ncbi:MAG: 50S ribosome-binding GTPase [Lachnospiraceae bacterium]|nr:50S ribosome-binding GTPase [Lachnospiraceae bacterium]
MGKMIYLMGKSSSGKDTIYRKLLGRRQVNFKKVVPYTTRPIRMGETEGEEYHFTDEAGYMELEAQGKIIEARVYHTYHGMWRYFTVDDGSIDLSENNYLIIGTIESYINTANYFGRDKVLPVLLELDDGIRLRRALNREMQQENPRYEEMCRRFLADAEDFSEERIEEAGIERRFRNENLDRCLADIKEYIRDNR